MDDKRNPLLKQLIVIEEFYGEEKITDIKKFIEFLKNNNLEFINLQGCSIEINLKKEMISIIQNITNERVLEFTYEYLKQIDNKTKTYIYKYVVLNYQCNLKQHIYIYKSNLLYFALCWQSGKLCEALKTYIPKVVTFGTP
ncbi:TPA: hypothetical protein KNH77_003814 [Clostridioides difficile]|nr:hypothetical protein [Clostridioides difficile]